MCSVISSRRLPIPALLRIAVIALLPLTGLARAADQPFDAVVTADSTEVMAGDKQIGKVPKGTRLTVSQTSGDWYLVNAPGNPPRQGWIRSRDVQAASSAASPVQLGAEQIKQQLKQRDRFDHEADEFIKAGKFDEAIAAAEKMLAIERTVLGADSPDAIRSLAELSWLHQAKLDFATARNLSEQVLAATIKRYGENHWRATNARLERRIRRAFGKTRLRTTPATCRGRQFE